MVDEADMSVERMLTETQARIAMIRREAQIPSGRPGTCSECGFDNKRLIDGVCSPCRDQGDNHANR